MPQINSPRPSLPPVQTSDYALVYDIHPDYVARRVSGSFEQEQISLEVTGFKLPNLLNLLEPGTLPSSVLEIGCATGELIAAFPVAEGGQKFGIDISAENIHAARERFPFVKFEYGDFTRFADRKFACVVLSDILEHVEDDAGFLRSAASMADQILVNLPLEDNWLNRRRAYGPTDPSGHLRRYSLADGLQLFSRAGLSILKYRRVWIHETATELKRRELRLNHCGHAYSGNRTTRLLKGAVQSISRTLRPVGRRLFASNLFALAVKKGG